MKMRVLALMVAFFAGSTAFAANDYLEDIHYVRLAQKQPVETGEKIEVRELFWYGCPHCNNLEPILVAWLKDIPANAAFVRTAAALNESWEAHAKIYYTLEILDLVDALHGKVFDAIHKERKPLRTEADILAFVAANGVDKARFSETFNSFAVDSKLRQSRIMARRYEADSVPTIIVDGRFRATATMAGGHRGLMDLVNFLIKKSAQERKAPAS